jgi:glycosyltransferase involved in cell wall biosynthesis
MPAKLAIVATHPIQYYAPWFACLTRQPGLALRVFYLWDFGVTTRIDRGFQAPVRWDIPLLEGYGHEFVPNHSAHPGTASFLGLWNPELPARLARWRPDAVLLTAYNFATLGYFLARRRASDAPLIFRGDSHRLVRRPGLAEPLRRALVSAVFRRMDAFLYVGSANREYFERHGVPGERLFYAPHAVDNARFRAAQPAARAAAPAWRRTLGIPEHARVILFAGKLEEKKRPLDLLQAFAAAKLERACLLFVGSGAQEAALRNAAAGRRDVFFAPLRNQSEMPLTYCAGDVFVLPSFGPFETWGLAVNEAMCMGLPVIASDHVGCARDLVLDHETGLTFRAGDVDALRAALQLALADGERLKRWGANASERIRAYDYEATTAGLLASLRFLGLAAA